jgi:hypothetical protein
MIEPQRSAFIFSLMFGGFAIVATAIAIGNQRRRHSHVEYASLGAMALTGMAMLMLGLLMCLVDIIYYGYK